MLFRVFRYSPDGDKGGGGSDDDKEKKGVSIDDVRRVIRREGRGSVNRTIQHLLQENAKYRERARTAEANAKKGATVKDGEVLLTEDEAKEWTAFQELGKKPAELKKSLEQLTTLEAEKTQAEFDRIVAEAADELGWNPVLLPTVLRDKKLAVEMRDVVVQDEDGKKSRVSALHVRPADKNDAPWEIVDAYVERELASYLPSLEAVSDGEETDERDGAEFDADDEGAEELAPDTDVPPVRTPARDRDTRRTTGANGAYGRRNPDRGTGRERTRSSGRGAYGTRNAGTNGARDRDGVPFPSQGSARRETGRTRLDELAAKKNADGSYQAF